MQKAGVTVSISLSGQLDHCNFSFLFFPPMPALLLHCGSVSAFHAPGPALSEKTMRMWGSGTGSSAATDTTVNTSACSGSCVGTFVNVTGLIDWLG